MKLRYLLSISLLAVSTLIAACGGPTEGPVNNANTTAAKNTNASVTNTGSNAVAVTTPTPDQVTNDAPTLSPVYKAYCAAVEKKDEAAIRKFYTADTLKFLEDDMKDNGIKTLVEYLKDDKVDSKVCSVSNERIKGDKAVGRVKPSESYPNGFEVLFVKEGGEWKMSNITPEKGFN